MSATTEKTLANPEQRIADLERQLAEREVELAECKAERDEYSTRRQGAPVALQRRARFSRLCVSAPDEKRPGRTVHAPVEPFRI